MHLITPKVRKTVTFYKPEANNIVVPTKNPSLKLVGTDGNAFALLGRAKDHNRKYRLYSGPDMSTIMDEATSGDYDHLLATLMHFFNVK